MINTHVLQRIQRAVKTYGMYALCKGSDAVVLVNTGASHNALAIYQAIDREFSSDDAYSLRDIEISSDRQCVMLGIEESDARNFELFGVSICTNKLDKVQTITIYW